MASGEIEASCSSTKLPIGLNMMAWLAASSRKAPRSVAPELVFAASLNYTSDPLAIYDHATNSDTHEQERTWNWERGRLFSVGVALKASIIKERSCITLIDVLDVDPRKQDELIMILMEARDKILKYLPGFISSNIHKSIDGRRVTSYEQWDSKEHVDAMYNNPEVGKYIEQAVQIAKAESPYAEALYTVEYVVSGN